MTPALSRPELPPISFLAELSEEDRRLLSGYGEFLPVGADQLLIREGTPQDSLYLVISGVLHITREKNGVRTLLWRASSGETIGEVNLFDPVAASADVTAQEFSQIWKASRSDLELFLGSYPVAGAQLMVAISGLLSRRLRAMNARFATLQEALAGHQAWHG
jgi:CRP/FNR family transcriptional regulator, cyclic AMP receptor protein